jgi:hypothetical protein
VFGPCVDDVTMVWSCSTVLLLLPAVVLVVVVVVVAVSLHFRIWL